MDQRLVGVVSLRLRKKVRMLDRSASSFALSRIIWQLSYKSVSELQSHGPSRVRMCVRACVRARVFAWSLHAVCVSACVRERVRPNLT